MRVAVVVLLVGALALGVSGAPFLSSPMPIVPPRSGGDAGYYFWDSFESSEWAPVYEWFEPIEPQGWRADDAYWTAFSPFDIRFCGETYPAGSTFYVGSNGLVGFAGDNLDVEGAAPEKRWYITYSPWYFYNGGINPIEFQVVIVETGLTTINNTVEFHYRYVDGDSWRDHGASGTVGLENGGGVEAVRYSFDQPVIFNEFAIGFVDQHYVDDQIGEFHLLTPEDGYQGSPGETIHFTWEAAEYSGHGNLFYSLYLADNSDFDDAVIFEIGEDTGMH